MKKKVAPALAVVLLIVVVVGIGFLTRLIQKYTPSSEVMDSQEYFGLDSDDEAAIVVGSEIISYKGKLIGVVAYYVYTGMVKLVKKKKNDGKGSAAALAAAGAAGALTNTLLVMNGIYFLFGGSYANAKGIATDALYGVILGVIGTQGVPEAIVAAVLTAAIGKALLHIRR